MTQEPTSERARECLTPGTVWKFHAYGVSGDYRKASGVRVELALQPPDGKGGQPYSYPAWYNHDWYKRLEPVQVDELRDAIHNAIEPIIGRWQGNPSASQTTGADVAGLREATDLAVNIWRQHFRDQSPEWKPLPDLRGVISQIDNMVTGLMKKPVHEEVCISPELAARLSPAPEIEPVGEVKVLNRRSKRRRAL